MMFEIPRMAKALFPGWFLPGDGENPDMPLPPWKKVLWVDLGFLGDTVHSIPAVRAVAAAGARVDVMTTQVGSELLALVPEVHRSWVVPLKKPSPPPWRGLGMILEIRREKYDAAITPVGSDRNLFSTALSGARERVAHLTGKNSSLARLGLTLKLAARDRSQPVFSQRLSLLRDLGWSGADPGWAWAISAEDRSWAAEAAPRPFLHLSVNAASTPLNEWLLDDWAATLRGIWSKRPNLHILASGAGSERESARLGDLQALVQDPRLKILPGRLSVGRLAALILSAELHLGLDSGVLHLAMSLGKPTVSLFRDSVGRPGWAPRGPAHRVLVRPCDCQSTGRVVCQGNRARCLSEIRPAEVAQAVLGALPNGSNR